MADSHNYWLEASVPCHRYHLSSCMSLTSPHPHPEQVIEDSNQHGSCDVSYDLVSKVAQSLPPYLVHQKRDNKYRSLSGEKEMGPTSWKNEYNRTCGQILKLPQSLKNTWIRRRVDNLENNSSGISTERVLQGLLSVDQKVPQKVILMLPQHGLSLRVKAMIGLIWLFTRKNAIVIRLSKTSERAH